MRKTVDTDQVHLASDCPIWNLYLNITGEAEQPEVVLKAYRKLKVQLHDPAASPPLST